MNVLLIGSGGREHAIAWSISQSPLLGNLYIAPGNPGTAQHGNNINIDPLDFEGLKQFIVSNSIKLVIVGPEEPLVKGIHDFFRNDSVLKEVSIIGPKMKGAMLEGSKNFSKGFMVRHGIPTAQYRSFTSGSKDEAFSYLESIKPPYVLKADGLAAGKGVIICNALDEAKLNLSSFFDGKFGIAGEIVVIEEYLEGIEISIFILSDGDSYVILPEAKDYKRIGENDTGPNTGGMGAVSPVPFATNEFMQKVEERIIKPTVAGLKMEGIDYVGFIFIGLMNVKGNPYVIEYNARLGDPETQAILPRLKTDFLDLLIKAGCKKLSTAAIECSQLTSTAVILVSGGYPESYEKGFEIQIQDTPSDTLLFHAGTKLDEKGRLVNSGGRVFASVGLADSISKALEKSYMLSNNISYRGKYFRKDIGKDLLNY